jgi:hypothetical protein
MKGVTHKYTGDSDAPVWTLRANSNFQDRQAPMVGKRPFVKKIPNSEEIQEYCVKQGWDGTDKKLIQTAKRHLLEDQEASWRTDNRNGMVSTEPPPKKKLLTSK